MTSRARNMRAASVFTVMLLASQATARADVVVDWNIIAVNTAAGQAPPVNNPFFQARFVSITQLAVFEAVNAINGGYEPYLGTVAGTPGASAEAAAIAAAHTVLKNYFPGSAAALDAARASSLAAIPDGQAKTDGIAVGEAAAQAMIANRVNDGSAPQPLYLPGSALAGEWQLTPVNPPAAACVGGLFTQWPTLKPFGIPDATAFILGPPPDLSSSEYAKDYAEVAAVGDMTSAARPADRTHVALFYASLSPTQALNSAARQLSVERGDSLSENARAFAILNMSINDSLIVSFATKYTYNFWRPVTAIRNGNSDGNPKTDENTAFLPFISTPCFPSYPSNHASGTNGGLEALRRTYGAAGHDLTLVHPNAALGSLHYTSLKQIAADVDDARVFGGIHFRFDQVGGHRVGREVATYVDKHNLRKTN